MEVSSAFVVIMGMGVTFVGLTCIIFLTILMGKILSKPEAPKPAAAAAAPSRQVTQSQDACRSCRRADR